TLGGDERRAVGGLGDARLDAREREASSRVVRDRQRIERVDADVLRIAAVARMSSPSRHGDDIRPDTEIDVRGRSDGPGGRVDLEMIAVLHAEARRSHRVDL